MQDLMQSRYTSTVDDECGLLLYNAASGAFRVADEATAACYASCGREHPELAASLEADGFLTALSPEEELDEQRRAFLAKRTDHSTMKIAIGLTYACNCRCIYCYEQDKIVNKQRIPDDVQEAICRFIQDRFDQHPFEKLIVQWYGGEPTLCLDIIAAMAKLFIAWCDEHGVTYDSNGLSNGVRLDAEAAQLLAEARVSSIYLTIDGPRDLHNARRPAVDADDPFERNMEAIANLRAAGIVPYAAMNTDKVNAARWEELEAFTQERFGLHVNPVKLNDYAHSYECAPSIGGPGGMHAAAAAGAAATGTGAAATCAAATDAAATPESGSESEMAKRIAFAPPDFDLYTHPEFARQQFAWFAGGNPTADDVRAVLQPAPNFCAGQTDGYFVIDSLGDVYKCDGWMGEPGHALFNLLDSEVVERVATDPDAPELHVVTFDPFESAKCRACELLPLCWGNCYWERELTGMPCHPLKTTLPDYLRLLASLENY